jgi:hypothetical protein
VVQGPGIGGALCPLVVIVVALSFLSLLSRWQTNEQGSNNNTKRGEGAAPWQKMAEIMAVDADDN